MTKRPQPRILVLLALAVLLVPFACRRPTQMTIEVRMFGDLPCRDVQSIAIIANRDRAAAERSLQSESYTTELFAPTCDASGRVGTLVITPQDDAGVVIVAARVVGVGRCAYVPSKPEESYRGCIIARRAFDFIAHTPLSIPISLEGLCLDVPCDVGSSCRAKVCVDDAVTCDPDGNCTSAAEPQRLVDGGSAPPPDDVLRPTDGGPDGAADAQTDAPTDAGGDARSDAGDGGPSGATNLCPLTTGPAECAAADSCCDANGVAFGCEPVLLCESAGAFSYRCNGRKGCANDEYCCASNAVDTVQPRSRCGICSPPSVSILCSVNDDCPPGMACNGQYRGNNGMILGLTLKACTGL